MEAFPIPDKDVNVSSARAKDEEKKAEAQAAPVVELDFEEARAPILYSKRSIALMVLFSGLAIGSDAYNSSLMGQLLLLLTVIYEDTLDVGTQSQLTNAFIIGMVGLISRFGTVIKFMEHSSASH